MNVRWSLETGRIGWWCCCWQPSSDVTNVSQASYRRCAGSANLHLSTLFSSRDFCLLPLCFFVFTDWTDFVCQTQNWEWDDVEGRILKVRGLNLDSEMSLHCSCLLSPEYWGRCDRSAVAFLPHRRSPPAKSFLILSCITNKVLNASSVNQNWHSLHVCVYFISVHVFCFYTSGYNWQPQLLLIRRVPCPPPPQKTG